MKLWRRRVDLEAVWCEEYEFLLDLAEDMRGYVPQYFADRWDYDASLERSRAFWAAMTDDGI